jgi:acyl-[acyl-carrier-protein]-phospholipid O-acyltransferase / long-chain-fatty-acid--[acyl-carrier-protein] ligase
MNRSEIQAAQTSRSLAAGWATPFVSRWQLGFWSLVITQFQGAFNDNALKFLVIYLIVDMGLPGPQRDWLVLVIGALFALPFILFSMTGGYLADRFSKRSVTIGTKWMELAVMAFVLLALGRGNLIAEAVGVFLLSSQAALFGPSKYGLLPELLSEKDLSWGNGVIELGTFLASITATVAAGFLAFYFRGQQHWSGVALLGCTVAGLAFSLGISRVPAANPSRKFDANPLGDFFVQVGLIRRDPILTWAIIGNFYLWFLAALLQFTIVIYGHDILRIDERHISYLQAGVAIGIGLGSLVTGYLSESKIEYGLIPLGAAGMTVFGFLSAMGGLSLARVGVYLSLLGFFGGFYAVPLNALIQHRPDPQRKGGIIAAANLISFVGVFLAAGVYFVLSEPFHLGADRIFFVGAWMTVAATLYTILLLPDSLWRLALWFLTHTIYHVRVEGRDHIPERGSALFLAQDLDPWGALFLAASTDRPIHFLIEDSGTRVSLLERAMHIGGHITGRITVSPPPDSVPTLEKWLGEVAATLLRGEVVCLAGPRMPRLFQGDSPARQRLEEILASAAAPVVAVALSGERDGFLRVAKGRLAWNRHGHWPCTVRVRFAAPRLVAAEAFESASGG